MEDGTAAAGEGASVERLLEAAARDRRVVEIEFGEQVVHVSRSEYGTLVADARVAVADDRRHVPITEARFGELVGEYRARVVDVAGTRFESD